MSAQIIDFAAAARKVRPAAVTTSTGEHATRGIELTHDFKFWTGASGKGYVHTLFTLMECPEVGNANLMLVRNDAGRRQVLYVGRLEHGCASLNLAEIRHLGATVGANEVHLHLLAEDARQRRVVEIDLQAALARDEQTRAS